MTRRLRSRIGLAVAVVAAAATVLAMPAGAARSAGETTTAANRLDLFPTEIALPDGFLPEGIAIGVLPYAFFGSRADGDLYRAYLVRG